MATTLLEKSLVDLQAEGKKLKTGKAKTKKGEKVFLLVDRQWFGEEGRALCAFTKGGRPFSKEDSLYVWKKDGELNAAVLNDEERYGGNPNDNKYTDLVFAN